MVRIYKSKYALSFLVSVVFTCINLQAAIKSFKVESGRYVSYEANIFADNNRPTLVFLPGLYRGWNEQDEFIQTLKKDNINYVAIHYSLQPESILKIPKNEIAYVNTHTYSASLLADEVDLVIKKLKIKNPLIVGLSYSSIVTTELSKNKKYSTLIETAPMIRFDESDPSGGQVTDFWQNFFNLNPFTGPIITRWYLKQTYSQYWGNIVDGILKSNPKLEKAQIRDTMVNSYTEMSMMAHGFDFTKQNFSNGIMRLFILGANEDEKRYNLQLKAISQYEQDSGNKKSTVVISKAGHIVPADAPDAYVKILKSLLK